VRLIIRTDASPSVGTGHFMRSSTIAEEFLSLGHEVCFVGKIDPMNLIIERFQELGLGFSVADPKEFRTDNKNDILLIDSYSVPTSDPFITRENWFKTVSISDSITPKYDVDLIIKPSLITRTGLDGGSRILSGPEYIMLRSSITQNRPQVTTGTVPMKILVVGGGSDPSGFCNAVVEALARSPYEFVADVFSDNFDRDLQADQRIRIHKVSLQIEDYARDCDLALTLASTLAIELIARGVPIGIASAFENQISGAQEMLSLGLAAPIGNRDISGTWIIDSAILHDLITSEAFRSNLRSKVSGLIDWLGAHRVALEILSL